MSLAPHAPPPSFPPPLASVPLAGGRLALSGRPKLRALATMRDLGVTHVVTLQADKENARAIGDAATHAGLGWIWQPLENGAPPPNARDAEMIARLACLREALAGGAFLLMHCAAGVHRTGMIGYALLRWCGTAPDDARRALHDLRPVTARGVTEARLAWADRFLIRVAQP